MSSYDVFISYSHDDATIGREIHTALKIRNRRVWMDWTSIPPTAEWWKEITDGIKLSDNFVFLISPSSIASPVCNLEIDYARSMNKRIIPVLLKDTDEKTAHVELIHRPLSEYQQVLLSGRDLLAIANNNWKPFAKRNWVVYSDTSFEIFLEKLITALDTDIDYVSEHTWLLSRADDWEKHGRLPSALLQGKDILRAEKWRDNSNNKIPQPLDLQFSYIDESRRVEDYRANKVATDKRRTRRLRLTAIIAGIIGILSLLATGEAIVQTTIAQNQASTALVAQEQAIEEQQNAIGRENLANTRVAIVGQTLTPIPATIQAGIHQIETATIAQGQAFVEVATAQANFNVANALAIDAQTEAAHAESTLTPISSTLTSVAQSLVEQQNLLFQAGQTLTPIPITLTVVGKEIQYNQQISESLRLAALANNVLAENTSPEVAVLLSIRALKTAYTSPADTALITALGRPLIHRIYQHNAANTSVYSAVFSPDGRFILSGGHDGTARLWDRDTGDQIRVFGPISDSYITSVAISLDNRFIATGGSTNAELWDLQTGELVHRFFVESPRYITRVVFSSNSKLLLTGDTDGAATLWDVETGIQLNQFITIGRINDLAFSPDDQFVLTTGYNGDVILWDRGTALEVRTFTVPSNTPRGLVARSVAFSPDGRFVLAGRGNSLGGENAALLWDADTGTLVHTFIGHTGGVSRVAFSPDGNTIATGGDDGTVRLWDITTGRLNRILNGHTFGITDVAFSPDGNFVVSSGDWTVQLWEVVANHQDQVFSGHTNTITEVQISPSGNRIITSSSDATARLYRSSGELIRVFSEGDNGAFTSIAFSPDERFMVTGSNDTTARLWNISTGQRISFVANPHPHRITSVAFSPDGYSLLIGTDNNVAQLWDVESGEEIRAFSGHTNIVTDVAFSPDGRFVLTGSDDTTARLWNAESGSQIQIFAGNAAIRSVAFSPDGRFVLTGSDDTTARLWNAESGYRILTFDGHLSAIRSVAFSPDGHFVLTGSDDTTARLWNAKTGELLRIFLGHTDQITSVTFSPDGRYIVTGSADGVARKWDTNYFDSINYACTRISRDFTAEERLRYGIFDNIPTCTGS